MYFPYFVTYILIGFAISLLVFFWALHTGQFSDQQRARYLPLEDDEPMRPCAASRFGRYETAALFVLAAAGVAASAAVLLFALMHANNP